MSNSYSFILSKVKSISMNNITTKNESTVSAMLECGSGDLDELQKLLELLNTTDNVDLLSKIFSAISAYLMFHNRTNIDKIIKSNAVYEKVCNVITKGSPRKVTETLNFLSALLYVEAEEVMSRKRTLALYARNMTRVSGCLANMSDMFCSSMMCIDTWKALCQCLAIACDQSEMNQSYCTHLVPLCVKKCNQENIDVLLVLQSLLFNHNRNVELFIKSNGLSVFTRDLLHYDKCLHLLTTVAQSSVVSPLLFTNTHILNNLYDFIKLYGPRSQRDLHRLQIGQKAMIILNHIDARARDKNLVKNVHRTQATRTICRDNNNSTRKDTITLHKDFPKANISVIKSKKDLNETSRLMQNVMKEVFRWKQEERRNTNKSVFKRNMIGKLQSTMNTQPKLEAVRHISNRTLNPVNEVVSEISKELTFSFLNSMEQDRVNHNDSHKTTITNQKCNTMNISNISVTDNNRFEDPTHFEELKEFVPISVSTPKRLHQRDTVSYKNNAKLTHTTKIQNIPKRIPKYKNQQRTITNDTIIKDKDMKNRTLGSRFLSAINESCTTLVKTVKNIFVKKESVDESKESNIYQRARTEFSFTDYMKRRDAVMKEKCMNNKVSPTNFSFETNSCRTCDDTQALRYKLLKDENLKQTIKKLKLGINLYGCDFKKISRTMWPRESYVTPAMLYNLYRKLLMK